MSDLRDLLEREARRVGAGPDELPAVERRAHRRRTVRRATTAVLALTLAAVGSLAAFESLRPIGDRVVPGGETGWRGAWPHMTRSEAEAAQARVDRGESEAMWLTDEVEVSLRYATDQQEWTKVVILDRERAENGMTIRLLGCDSLPAIGCAGMTMSQIRLEQLLRTGSSGIWSVTDAESVMEAAPPLSPGDPTPGPEPTGFQAEAERFVLEFLRTRLVRGRADLFLGRPAADAYHAGREGLSLHGEYVGIEVSGSTFRSEDAIEVHAGMTTDIGGGCFETTYETLLVVRHPSGMQIGEASTPGVSSSECVSDF